MDLFSDSDVPHSSCTVSSSRYQNSKAFVHFQAIDSTQVTMIVTDNFVHLQVPTLDGLVLSAGKEIRMLLRKLKCSDGVDVSS